MASTARPFSNPGTPPAPPHPSRLPLIGPDGCGVAVPHPPVGTWAGVPGVRRGALGARRQRGLDRRECPQMWFVLWIALDGPRRRLNPLFHKIFRFGPDAVRGAFGDPTSSYRFTNISPRALPITTGPGRSRPGATSTNSAASTSPGMTGRGRLLECPHRRLRCPRTSRRRLDPQQFVECQGRARAAVVTGGKWVPIQLARVGQPVGSQGSDNARGLYPKERPKWQQGATRPDLDAATLIEPRPLFGLTHRLASESGIVEEQRASRSSADTVCGTPA